MHDAQEAEPAPVPDDIAKQITECDAKLRGYRAALDAGADPGVVATWIADVQAERAAVERRQSPRARSHRMTEQEIDAMVAALGGIHAALAAADPDD